MALFKEHAINFYERLEFKKDRKERKIKLNVLSSICEVRIILEK